MYRMKTRPGPITCSEGRARKRTNWNSDQPSLSLIRPTLCILLTDRTRRDTRFLHVDVSMSDEIADFVEDCQEQSVVLSHHEEDRNGPSPVPFFPTCSNPDGPLSRMPGLDVPALSLSYESSRADSGLFTNLDDECPNFVSRDLDFLRNVL
jgi:hypothetical protein